MLHAILRRVGYQLHYTREPKAEDAPNSLFAPLEGYSTVRGSFGDQTVRRSLYTSLQTHPEAKWTAGNVVFGIIALLIRAARHNRTVMECKERYRFNASYTSCVWGSGATSSCVRRLRTHRS